ncbi:hypothetical protein RFI_02827 [Reticulomyxa filosa]|uniref:Vps16 C-terminal domain-containing protein n=1 Tax=Reticulomyxa filosa TaxID=46433 RepID=X6P7V7_RETFI|nr:hypothetical protein RFI_02827 [Reticulomyxa filosa]|eukprot:ETO34271.1 hypothetical protein RFI_02827 [Reticulomyxa filosa]
MQKRKMADPLMASVGTPSLHIAMGKIKEEKQELQKAYEYYDNGHDRAAMVKLLLFRLNDVQRAVTIIRERPSIETALIIAEFMKEKKDPLITIEFFLLAKEFEQAFEIAKVNMKKKTTEIPPSFFEQT